MQQIFLYGCNQNIVKAFKSANIKPTNAENMHFVVDRNSDIYN